MTINTFSLFIHKIVSRGPLRFCVAFFKIGKSTKNLGGGKYVCWLKFEISECPTKPLYVTYSPYKYELKRIKTHEIRATYFLLFFASTVSDKKLEKFSC